MSTRLSRRNAQLLKKYPILELVPEEKRHKIFRKAVLHPVILVFLVALGGFILPMALDYLILLLAIPEDSSDPLTLIKLLLLVAIPFLIILMVLKKLLLPFCLRRVLAKEGYLNDRRP